VLVALSVLIGMVGGGLRALSRRRKVVRKRRAPVANSAVANSNAAPAPTAATAPSLKVAFTGAQQR